MLKHLEEILEPEPIDEVMLEDIMSRNQLADSGLTATI